MIKGKRILITGMAGSIGSELARQLSKTNKVFGFDQNETELFKLRNELKQLGRWVHTRTGNIRDKHAIADAFEDFKPQIVFHAAALKNVQPCEEYPDEAIQTNIVGTYNVFAEAKRWECLEKFVFVSTDKVVNTHSIMGISKKMGEVMVTNQGKGFVAVRFANVLGSSGSLIPIWQQQVNDGQALTVTDPEMTRYFMTIPQACELVIEAAEDGKGGEVYILDMGKPVNIYELAKGIIDELKGEIKVIGKRPGETLSEELMTAEEQRLAVRKGKFWIING